MTQVERKPGQTTSGEPKLTRRQFLESVVALGASAALSACGANKEKPSPEQPTETPTPTETILPEASTQTLSPTETISPTKAPTQTKEPTVTPTPEFTPTPEVIKFLGTTITADYLRKAAGIDGVRRITDSRGKEITLAAFVKDYVSQSWGKEIDFTTLPQNLAVFLQCLVSLGADQGVEGVFTPGKQGGEVIFPQLEGLSFLRLTLEKVPSGEQQGQEYLKSVSPRGLPLRPDTQMTVVGWFNEPKSEEEITVDKEAAGGEFDFVLVAFTDYLRSSQEGVPRHYLAILPTHLPADPDNKNALTLENLLEANGYSYDPQANEITFIDPQTKKQTKVGINRIEGEELIKDLREATGLAFVDQMKGELIKDPLVPYLDQMPAVWELNREEDDEGKTTFLLQGQNTKGELVPYARASYDEEKGEWRWEKIVVPEVSKEEVLAIAGLELKWSNKEARWEYVDPSDGLVAGFWNGKEGRFELTANRLRGEWRGLYVPRSPEETERAFSKAWNQGKGEIKLPIPFELGEGEMVADRSRVACFGLRNIPPGTILYAPFGGEVVKRAGSSYAIIDLVWSWEEDLSFAFYFKSFEDYLGPGYGRVETGTPLVRVSDKLLSPLPPGGQRYQIELYVSEADLEAAFDLKFENLQRDEKGRFILVSP